MTAAEMDQNDDAPTAQGTPPDLLDPEQLNNPAEFMAGLRTARFTAGNPSLRDLQRTTGLPRSTIGHALDPLRTRLPPWDRTLTLLRAFGIPESEEQRWSHAWRRIQLAATATTTPTAASTDTAAITPTAPPIHDTPAPETSSAGRQRKILTHGVATLIGAVLGVTVTLSVLALVEKPGTQLLSVSDAPPCPAVSKAPSAPATKTGPLPASQPDSAPVWIARPASDAQILTLTGLDLPVTETVRSGDALIVSVMLTSACPGKVTASDSRGNHYGIVSDVTDSLHHRVLIIAALNINPLTTADRIHLSYPRSSKYHAAVDEFRGVSTAVQHTSAFGEAGGTAFTTSADTVLCHPGDLVVASVGSNTGSAPAFTDGWTALPVLKLSSYRLSTAYEIATSAEPCAVTGTTTSQWGAVLATFR